MSHVLPHTDSARALAIHSDDTVGVAVAALDSGEAVLGVDLKSDVPAGHKVALRDHEAGAPVIKYGFEIGRATAFIPAGAHVHSHNLRTGLDGTLDYAYEPVRYEQKVPAPRTFMGHRRADGRVATRNEIWVINTVGCVNRAAERVARMAHRRFGPEGSGQVDGVFAFPHPFGCSQLGDDLSMTRRILAGLLRHPNAGGVLVMGLGCENNIITDLIASSGRAEDPRLRYFSAQGVDDEIEAGLDAIEDLVDQLRTDQRVPCSASDLVLGVKCGGSDGFSGVTANPLVGRVTDRLTAHGGCVLLTEVPEMFGAEQVLMRRAVNEQVFDKTVALVNDFKTYFLEHGQPVYENPSPGNKVGGLTTLEEKSLGAIQKGGRALISDVLRYGDPVHTAGLSLLEAPGNDGVSSTAMIASGATVLLFTTGRGTPLGFPAPTIKISTNSQIASRKPHWIDFDAGPLLAGTSQDDLADELFDFILDTASGRLTNNEENDYREIAIWKIGVTL